MSDGMTSREAPGDRVEVRTTRPPKRRRRWLRRTLLVVSALVVSVAALYGWAWVSTGRSSIARAMVWMGADVGDRFRFPAREIPTGDDPSPLPSGLEVDLPVPPLGDGPDLDGFLRRTGTLAFVVAQDDRLVYERYFGGSERQTLQTSFSVAKSFLSTLVGIAIDEGSIGGLDDPVTQYVPELAERDPRFEDITLRNLLSMSSGLRYVEQSNPLLPWGDDIDTYYGTNLRDLALNATEITGPPGRDWLYNNYNPLLIGLALERATGMSVSQFMATRLWQPLGAEFDASWSLDSEGDAFEKMESGLNVTPLDYARFGLLYLHGGEWNGRVASSPATGCARRRRPRPRPIPPGSTSTSGGWTTNVRAGSTRWGISGSTSTSRPTPTPSSSATAATGASTTIHGSKRSERWPIVSLRRRDVGARA
jgi:CubicO group peptidase (beta-lactamase class C family)